MENKNHKIMNTDVNELNPDIWKNDIDMISLFKKEIEVLQGLNNSSKKEHRYFLESKFNKFPKYFKKNITLKYIKDEVCKYYEIGIDDLHEVTRKQEIVTPRQIAMYLCRRYTKLSSGKIGKEIGGKDHATVLHGIKKINNLLDTDKSFKLELEQLEDKIK